MPRMRFFVERRMLLGLSASIRWHVIDRQNPRTSVSVYLTRREATQAARKRNNETEG